MFHNNIVKISEILNKHNLLKTCLQYVFPYWFFAELEAIFLQYGKKMNKSKF